MTKINTNWSSPKTNIFSALNSLRGALNSGQNARLIKMRNEDCAYPIRQKITFIESDFKKYVYCGGYLTTRKEIQERTNLSDFEKYLSINFKTFYGTQEAVEAYYNTGVLSKDNFKSMGISHLVKVSDMAKFHIANGESDYAKLFDHYDVNQPDDTHFYDFFRLKQKQDQLRFAAVGWVEQSETHQMYS